jgi:hypothetical protein
VSKLVARLLPTATLWIRMHADISQKYKIGGMSKGVANTLQPAEKKRKRILISCVADPDPDPPDPCVLGLLDPDPLVRGMDPDPDPSIIMQNW